MSCIGWFGPFPTSRGSTSRRQGRRLGASAHLQLQEWSRPLPEPGSTGSPGGLRAVVHGRPPPAPVDGGRFCSRRQGLDALGVVPSTFDWVAGIGRSPSGGDGVRGRHAERQTSPLSAMDDSPQRHWPAPHLDPPLPQGRPGTSEGPLVWTRHGITYVSDKHNLRIIRHGASHLVLRHVLAVRISGNGQHIVTWRATGPGHPESIWYGDPDGPTSTAWPAGPGPRAERLARCSPGLLRRDTQPRWKPHPRRARRRPHRLVEESKQPEDGFRDPGGRQQLPGDMELI